AWADGCALYPVRALLADAARISGCFTPVARIHGRAQTPSPILPIRLPKPAKLHYTALLPQGICALACARERIFWQFFLSFKKMTIWLTAGAIFIRANYIPDWLVD